MNLMANVFKQIITKSPSRKKGSYHRKYKKINIFYLRTTIFKYITISKAHIFLIRARFRPDRTNICILQIHKCKLNPCFASQTQIHYVSFDSIPVAKHMQNFILALWNPQFRNGISAHISHCLVVYRQKQISGQRRRRQEVIF